MPPQPLHHHKGIERRFSKAALAFQERCANPAKFDQFLPQGQGPGSITEQGFARRQIITRCQKPVDTFGQHILVFGIGEIHRAYTPTIWRAMILR